MLYPVAIQQKEGVFHAHLPDIPSLEIQDSSMANTISKARELVMNHLSELIEGEYPIPEPSEISDHLINPKFAGWTWAIVNLDISRVVGEEVNLSVNISQRLHKKLEEHLQANDIKIKDFIVSAIKDKL